MSLTDFAALDVRSPELQPALRAFARWRRSHPTVRLLEPARLSRDLKNIDIAHLSLALNALVRAGELRKVFMVKTPTGVLAQGEFEDVSSIPEKLRDSFNDEFNTSDSEIVLVFKTGAEAISR